jgi:hypothetical protein
MSNNKGNFKLYAVTYLQVKLEPTCVEYLSDAAL